VAVDTARVSRPPPHRSPRAGRQPPNAGRARPRVPPRSLRSQCSESITHARESLDSGDRGERERFAATLTPRTHAPSDTRGRGSLPTALTSAL